MQTLQLGRSIKRWGLPVDPWTHLEQSAAVATVGHALPKQVQIDALAIAPHGRNGQGQGTHNNPDETTQGGGSGGKNTSRNNTKHVPREGVQD